MLITNLNLANYRSYTTLDLQLEGGVSIFVGKNGEGKTNIAESILYLTFLNSHRASGNTPLIKLGNQSAYIRAKIKYPEREILVELEINGEKANRAKVNQNPVRSQKEIFGIVQTIYFSPEDLDIVRGDPSERRRFIDQLLTLRSPRIAGVITDYERAVKQRNSLLKTRASNDALAPWDKQVADFGGQLIALRMAALVELKPLFNQIYKEISDTKPAEIIYKSSIENPSTDDKDNTTKIMEKLINNRGAEGASEARQKIGDPQSLESVLSEVISGRNWGKGVAEGNLFSDWQQIVGAEISEHTTPISLVDGRLTIQSSSTAWATQMRLMQNELLTTISNSAPGALVEELNVIGPNAPSWKKGLRSIKGAKGPRDTYG